MKWFTNIFVLVFIVCPSALLGQTYFNQRFPPEPGSWGSGTRSIEVDNESYFTHRWSVINSTGFSQIQFCKVNSIDSSIEVLSQYSDSNYYIVPSKLKKGRNGFFIETCAFEEYGSGKRYFGVYRFNSDWTSSSRFIDSTEYKYISMQQVLELPSSDFITIGTINLTTNFQNRNLVVIKTDSLGYQIWKKTFRLSNNSWGGECIALAQDGGFFIGGAEVNYNLQNSFTRALVMKLDSNGNHQWHRFFGDMTHSSAPVYGISAISNGGCAFVGGVGLPYVNNSGLVSGISPWIVGLDDFGQVIWADTNSPEQPKYGVENYYTDIESLSDGSFVVTGQRDIWDSVNTGVDKWRMHGVIAKYSKVGEPQWVRNYRHPEVPDEGFPKHLLFDIDPTPDGGFVAAGYLNPSIDNTQDTWILKVDSFGCLVKGCEITSVPKVNTSISSMRIYPNPASEVVHFDITPNTLNAAMVRSRNSASKQTYELKLFDITGKLVLTQTLKNNENTMQVAHLKPGVYNYRLNETWGSLVVE